MKMVDVNIKKKWCSGPKSRSVNICSASKLCMICVVGFLYFEKIAFLDLFDMHLMIFDIHSQYLVNIWSDLVNIWSKLININQI